MLPLNLKHEETNCTEHVQENFTIFYFANLLIGLNPKVVYLTNKSRLSDQQK